MDSTVNYVQPFTVPSLSTEHSNQLDQLALALSKLQGELPHVGKDSRGYSYNYADLASTLDVLKPLLVKHGFSMTQFEDGSDNLVTMLLHSSGQWIKGRMKIITIGMKGANEAQQKGAVLSYFRRYSIQAIFGMAAEDSDAADKKDVSPKIPANTTVSTSAVKEASGDLDNGVVVSGPVVADNVGTKRSFRKPKTESKEESL